MPNVIMFGPVTGVDIIKGKLRIKGYVAKGPSRTIGDGIEIEVKDSRVLNDIGWAILKLQQGIDRPAPVKG